MNKYRICSEQEKEELLEQNKKDITKSAIEFASLVAVSFVAAELASDLNPTEITEQVATVVGGLGLIGLDINAFYKFAFRMMDRERLENNQYTTLYNENTLNGRSK